MLGYHGNMHARYDYNGVHSISAARWEEHTNLTLKDKIKYLISKTNINRQVLSQINSLKYMYDEILTSLLL